MSQPAVKALDLPFELVQRIQMNLLIDVIRQAMAARGREDFFTGGNMFVYYSVEQARDVAAGRRCFRGPDVFFVDHVAPRKEERKAWVSWEEGGPATSISPSGPMPGDGCGARSSGSISGSGRGPWKGRRPPGHGSSPRRAA